MLFLNINRDGGGRQMDKKGYIQSANGKDIRMGNCKCCNKKGTNKISIGIWDATEKNSSKCRQETPSSI